MSRNGSGVYSLPAGNPVVTGTTISSTWANTTLSDIATALTGSVASDGQTAMTGNLQMGGNKVTGIAVATTLGDALSYGRAATVTDLAVTGNATVGGTLTLTGGLTLNGNVTVGDSSSDTLTVNATSTFAAGATFSSTFAANGGVTLGDASGDALTINSSAVSIPNGLNFDSNTLVIDATNNRVGVGTASPSYNFDVSATSPTVRAVSSSGTGSVSYRIDNTGGNTQLFRDSSTGGSFSGTAYAAGIFNSGAYPFILFTNSTERIRIDSSGNVGIGTSSPTQKLTLSLSDLGGISYGDRTFTGTYYLGTTSGAGNAFGGNSTYIGFAGTGTSAADIIIQPNAGNTIFRTAQTTEVMRLNSSGNLGLGVTPSAWNSSYKAIELGSGSLVYPANATNIQLRMNAYTNSGGTEIYKATGIASLYSLGGGGNSHVWYIAPSGTAGNAITFTQAMTLDASGNLGIGTTSPALPLTVQSGAATQIRCRSTTTRYRTSWGIDTSGNTTIDSYDDTGTVFTPITINGNPLQFSVSGTERMRIDSSGNLLVGTTTATEKLTVAGNISINTSGNPFLQIRTSGAGNNPYIRLQADTATWDIQGTFSNAGDELYLIYGGSNRGYFNSSTGAYVAVSDQRLKKNITNISYGLDSILSLRAVEYNMATEEDSFAKHLGFIAQEAQVVLPSSVSEMTDGMFGMDKTEIIPVLVKAIQEQQAIINDLKARIETLESK